MIKAVLFDIDGVLVDSFDLSLKFYQNLFIQAGYEPLTAEQFLPLMHYTMEEAIKEYTGGSAKEVQRILNMGKTLVYPYERLKLPKYGREVIKKLSERYLLGIVTNRLSRGIGAILSETKIQEYFQTAVGFDDTKKHKPDPEPLLLVCKSLKIKPEETVYIGDAESDSQAAKTAGIAFILFGKKNFLKTSWYAHSFEKLPEIIAHI